MGVHGSVSRVDCVWNLRVDCVWNLVESVWSLHERYEGKRARERARERERERERERVPEQRRRWRLRVQDESDAAPESPRTSVACYSSSLFAPWGVDTSRQLCIIWRFRPQKWRFGPDALDASAENPRTSVAGYSDSLLIPGGAISGGRWVQIGGSGQKLGAFDNDIAATSVPGEV